MSENGLGLLKGTARRPLPTADYFRYLLAAMIDPRRFSRPTFLFIFSALVVYLIGNAQVPLVDRDEPRYAQCSRQMLESGDWVVPRLYDELRTAKPPIIYWCQATAMQWFDVNEFSARFPSAIAMAATLLIVAIAVRRAAGIERAFWTVLVFGSSILTLIAAKTCLTDSVLLLFITIGQVCVYRFWRGIGGWGTVFAFGVADGIALMIKGPVVFGVHAATLLALWFLRWSLTWERGQWKRVLLALAVIAAESLAGDYLPVWPGAKGKRGPAPMWLIVSIQALSAAAILLINRKRLASETTPVSAGTPEDPDLSREKFHFKASHILKAFAVIALIVAVGLPWAIQLEQRSPGFLKTMIFKEVGERASTAQEGHQGPFGYYLVSVWPTFLPWSLLLPAALAIGWQRRRDLHARFAMAAILGPWLMLEEVRTKLPHYILPAFIPLAFLTADFIVRCLRDGLPAFGDRAFRRAAVVWAAIIGVLACTPAFGAVWLRDQPWAAIVVLAVAGIGYAITVLMLLLRGKIQESLAAMGVGALLLYAILFRIYLPSCEFLRLSQQAAAVLRENGVTGRDQAIMLDYKEPSLAFYQGGTIREHSNMAITQSMLGTTPWGLRPAKRALYAAMGWKFAEMPDWAVITREVWESSKPKRPGQTDVRELLDIVQTFRGLDVADGMRVVEVMVVRRKPEVRVGP
jgi:4-amino-4-deoxy-L-arabinose transferase-like glycosyltransferase